MFTDLSQDLMLHRWGSDGLKSDWLWTRRVYSLYHYGTAWSHGTVGRNEGPQSQGRSDNDNDVVVKRWHAGASLWADVEEFLERLETASVNRKSPLGKLLMSLIAERGWAHPDEADKADAISKLSDMGK